ncbi:hypothetical protein CAEBREN_24986 [Caenorhabditis brenneri]|uniref:Uncharacterized protein n=1 Tax=Caenorhabditis brenneri TaxID=135651 RepID=G0PD77_CAEBE|nr:hypothetical protein CAEBREN_24986 [Caenorhabditis brenneri]
MYHCFIFPHCNQSWFFRVNWNCEFCKISIFSELDAFNHIVSDEHLARVVQWHCTYCSKNGHEVYLGNMLYAFRHIFSGLHWKNMNYITCHSDIQFWTSWIDSVVEVDQPPAVIYNPRVPPPATVTLDSVPVARVVPMKAATVTQQEEKVTITSELQLLAAKSTVVQDTTVTLDTVDQIATVTPMEPADPVNTVVEQESAVAEQSKSEKPETAVTKKQKNRQKRDKKKCCIQ